MWGKHIHLHRWLKERRRSRVIFLHISKLKNDTHVESEVKNSDFQDCILLKILYKELNSNFSSYLMSSDSLSKLSSMQNGDKRDHQVGKILQTQKKQNKSKTRNTFTLNKSGLTLVYKKMKQRMNWPKKQ